MRERHGTTLVDVAETAEERQVKRDLDEVQAQIQQRRAARDRRARVAALEQQLAAARAELARLEAEDTGTEEEP